MFGLILPAYSKPMSPRYTFTSAVFGLALAGASVQAQNAYLQDLEIGRYIKTNTNYQVKVKVRNAVSAPAVTSFRVGWRWNNGTVNLGPNQAVGGGGITTGNFLPYTHPNQLNVTTQGAGTLKVWVQVTGDTDQTNDTLTAVIKPITNWAEKTVLMDMKTATWCQYCPSANVVGNTLNADPFTVVAKFHSSDGFSNANATAYLNQMFNVNFTPAGLLEQGEYGSYVVNSNHGQWAAAVDARKLSVSPVSIQVTPNFNTSTRVLTVQVATTMLYAEAGTYTINAYILEDGVLGPQTNGGAGSNYVHNQVVREVLGPVTGTTGVIPANPVQGQTYTHTYTYTVPTAWNASNLRILAYATRVEGSGRLTLNAKAVGMLPVGIEERDALSNVFTAWPVPFAGNLFVDLPADPQAADLELFAVDGRLLATWRRTFNGAPVELDGLEGLPAGTYMLRVRRGTESGQRRVVKD